MRILNAEPKGYSQQARDILRQIGTVDDGPLDRAELAGRLPEYDILMVRLAHQVDGELLNRTSRLKAIATATTGLDHVDCNLAVKKGIAVLSLQGERAFLESISATAEFTWGLLLSLMRRIVPAAQSVKEGNWNRDAFRGRDLDGKRLGILGLGRIGAKVARYGLAFGMTVSAYDPFITDWPTGVIPQSNLTNLLREADVLTIHVPLSSETQGMLGGGELALLPPDAVVINTSRGEILDEKSLLAAMEAGQLAGAALDVMANERHNESRTKSPLVHYARRHDNLLLTPHLGGATAESMARTEVFMAKKIASFVQALHG